LKARSRGGLHHELMLRMKRDEKVCSGGAAGLKKVYNMSYDP
jgi:hypothetical protein